MVGVTADKCPTCGKLCAPAAPEARKWAVLVGGFSGDGSSEHSLFRLKNSENRVPIFKSHAAAEEYVLLYQIGEYALIAEVVVEALPATELFYPKTGSRLTAKSVER